MHEVYSQPDPQKTRQSLDAAKIVRHNLIPILANFKLGAIAQLVEHLHGMQGVSGSSPLSSILKPDKSSSVQVEYGFTG
jgi:hypothetical protein